MMINDQGFIVRGFFIPYGLLTNNDLSPSEKILLLLIHNLQSEKKGCFASNNFLSQESKLKIQSVKDTLTHLKKKHWIIVRRIGRERHIFINQDKWEKMEKIVWSPAFFDQKVESEIIPSIRSENSDVIPGIRSEFSDPTRSEFSDPTNKLRIQSEPRRMVRNDSTISPSKVVKSKIDPLSIISLPKNNSIKNKNGKNKSSQDESNESSQTRKKGTASKLNFYEDLIPPRLNNCPKFIAWWKRWIRVRYEARKKNMSEYAAHLQLKKLNCYSPEEAVEMITQSIENDWTGLFPVKTYPSRNNNYPSRNNNTKEVTSPTDPSFDEAIRLYNEKRSRDIDAKTIRVYAYDRRAAKKMDESDES